MSRILLYCVGVKKIARFSRFSLTHLPNFPSSIAIVVVGDSSHSVKKKHTITNYELEDKRAEDDKMTLVQY